METLYLVMPGRSIFATGKKRQNISPACCATGTASVAFQIWNVFQIFLNLPCRRKGPARQVGKSTLLKVLFEGEHDILWLNGDEPDIREMFEHIAPLPGSEPLVKAFSKGGKQQIKQTLSRYF